MRRTRSRRWRTVSSSGFQKGSGVIAASLNERHLVDLPERRGPREDLLERGVAEEGHALLARGLLDLRRRAALEDHLADPIGHVEELGHRGPAEEAGLAALRAAHGLVESLVGVDVGVETGLG